MEDNLLQMAPFVGAAKNMGAPFAGRRGKPAGAFGGGDAGGKRAAGLHVLSCHRDGRAGPDRWPSASARPSYLVSNYSRLAALIVLTASYAIAALLLSWRLSVLEKPANPPRNDWPIKKGPPMPGKNIVLTPLAARKRLLLAESELNRELLAHEWDAVAEGAREATRAIRKTGALVLSLSALVSAFSCFEKLKTRPPRQKRRGCQELSRPPKWVWRCGGRSGPRGNKPFHHEEPNLALPLSG